MSTNQNDVQALVEGTKVGAGSEPALEGDNSLFAELATHDEFEPPTTETPETTSEGAASGTTDATPPPAEPTPAAAPIPPAPVQEAQPSATPPVTAEVVPSPTEPVQQASAPAPEPQQAPPSEPVDFEKHRAETIPKLEKLYELTEEEADDFRVSPDKVLPKLAARLHYEITTAVFNSVLGSIPQQVAQTLAVQKAHTEAENAFYSKWPDLKDPKYQGTVINSIQAYKQANPRASLSEVMDRAGLMAMLSLGLTPRQMQQQMAAPPPMAKPVAPAGAGASSAPIPQRAMTEEQSVFAELVEAEQRGELY